MRRNRGRRAHSNFGSTIIEVLMAISVLAIGASGIIALQKVTVVANRNARTLEIANGIAQTWVERLQTDATLWNGPSPQVPSSDLNTDTKWLANKVANPGAAVWFRPVNATDGIYGVHDGFGRDDTSGNLNGPFCVNIRLTELRDTLIRAEVRVYWLRQGIQAGATSLSAQPLDPLCSGSASPAPTVENNADVYHILNVVTGLRKNDATN